MWLSSIRQYQLGHCSGLSVGAVDVVLLAALGKLRININVPELESLLLGPVLLLIVWSRVVREKTASPRGF